MSAIDVFTNVLMKCMVPVIRDKFIYMYKNPQDIEGGPSLVKFQKYLKTIHGWEKIEIDNQIREIEKYSRDFKCYIKALYVAYSKLIMNSVRTNSIPKNTHVKIPLPETFVHYCFVRSAKDVFENPDIIKSEHDGYKALDRLIRDSLESTILDLIPIQNILVDCIPLTGDSVNFDSTPPSHTFQSPPPLPASPPTQAPQETQQQPPEDVEETREDAFEEALNKESPFPSTQDIPKETENTELFEDAEDQVEKKRVIQ
jgi:hypothetical protein